MHEVLKQCSLELKVLGLFLAVSFAAILQAYQYVGIFGLRQAQDCICNSCTDSRDVGRGFEHAFWLIPSESRETKHFAQQAERGGRLINMSKFQLRNRL